MIQNNADFRAFVQPKLPGLLALPPGAPPTREHGLVFESRNNDQENDLYLAIHGTHFVEFRSVGGILQANIIDVYDFEFANRPNQSMAASLANVFALLQFIGHMRTFELETGWFNV